jgi:hypothetical protein
MPRKAKTTQTGAPAMPVSEIPGQMYGVGPEQMALQQAMPAPQIQQGAAAPPPAAPPPDGTVPPAPPVSLEDSLRKMQLEGGLLAPGTANPHIPVTNGLSSGPGAGPEALMAPPTSPLATTLKDLSRLTGDPMFEELARKNGLG